MPFWIFIELVTILYGIAFFVKNTLDAAIIMLLPYEIAFVPGARLCFQILLM